MYRYKTANTNTVSKVNPEAKGYKQKKRQLQLYILSLDVTLLCICGWLAAGNV